MSNTYLSKIGSFLFIGALGLTVDQVQSVLNVSNSNDFDALAGALFPSDSSANISKVTFVGDSNCIGSFSGGLSVVPELNSTFPDEGVVLATGNISNLPTQDSYSQTTDFSTPGDEDLDKLLGGDLSTRDACALEIEFFCNNVEPSAVFFNYVFGSDEYMEYVGSEFNDVFGLFLNGANIAIVPGTIETPVAINTVNQYTNNELYVSNGNGTYDGIEMDGFTEKLRTNITLAPPGMNTLKIVIADVSDNAYDSWVLLEAGSINCKTVLTSEPSVSPSSEPYSKPSVQPSVTPTKAPSRSPSSKPSSKPSAQPSITRTKAPSRYPSSKPSSKPSAQPSITRTKAPSRSPSSKPSSKPSDHPQVTPPTAPSAKPPSSPTSCKSTKGRRIKSTNGKGKGKTKCKTDSAW